MSKAKFIIALAALLAVAIAAVSFAVFSTSPVEEDPGTNQPPAGSEDYELTDGDKVEIQLLTDAFINTIGNYGWSPEVLANQSNLNLAKTTSDPWVVFNALEHTIPNDAVRQLSNLTDSGELGGSVNEIIFATPFSVRTTHPEQVSFPADVGVSNGFPSVELTVPLETTLLYVGQDYNYRDNDGNLILGGIRFETLNFEGTLNVTLTLKRGSWVVDGFNQDVRVLVTDKTFTVSNGQFESSNAMPVAYTIQMVNDDGSLGVPTSNLQRYQDLMSGVLAEQEMTQNGESANG